MVAPWLGSCTLGQATGLLFANVDQRCPLAIFIIPAVSAADGEEGPAVAGRCCLELRCTYAHTYTHTHAVSSEHIAKYGSPSPQLNDTNHTPQTIRAWHSQRQQSYLNIFELGLVTAGKVSGFPVRIGPQTHSLHQSTRRNL
eukprot:3937126-Rhodomonas_salina.2